MPMDGMMVGFAARELDRVLKGGRVDRITQPERDTVVLQIRAGNDNHRLLLCASPNNARCHTTTRTYSNPLEPPNLCMLMRRQLTGSRVVSVSQVGGDRIVHVCLEAVNELGDRVERKLVLEMMGRHSNLMLLDETGRILEATRHVNAEMSRVRQIQPGMAYLPPPEQDKLDPSRVTAEELQAWLREKGGRSFSKGLAESISGLSRVSAEELAFRILGRGTDEAEDPEEACRKAADFCRKLPEMTDPRVQYGQGGDPEEVMPFAYFSLNPDRQKAFPTVSQALEEYFGGRDERERMSQRSAAMVRTLKGQIERCERKLALQEEELDSAGRMDEYRAMGEAINANLYRLKKGMTEVELEDWYGSAGRMITVPLDEKLTPGQNAQKYFKKYQKARSARETAAQQKEKTLAELELLEGMLLDIDKCTSESDLEEIRDQLVHAGYMKRVTSRRQQRKLPGSEPGRYLSEDGIEILVGKNAAQNDRLTLGARPDEMWLHAKDMPGSHVIIRAEGEIPLATMKQAAQLAAWFSKGQRSSNVPVDYTRRKYVKKPGGAPPGKVIYTHHKTAYITAEEADIRAIRSVTPGDRP